MQPVKVLNVINRFGIGGSEKQSIELITRLDRTRFEPLVATMVPDGPWRSVVENHAIEIVDYPFTGMFNADGRRYIRSLASLIRARDVRLVHCHEFYSNVFGSLSARLAGGHRKVIASRREVGALRPITHRVVQRGAYSLADVVIANTDDLRDLMARRELVPSRKIRVIRNGIDVETFSPGSPPRGLRESLHIPDNADVVCVVARLGPEKNHTCILHALARLTPRFPALRLMVVGDGPMYQPLTRLTYELGLTTNVVFTGERSDVPDLLRLSDVVVLVSISEGLSNTILEALSAGRPVVASNVGGNRELITDGVEGFLIPHDRPDLLADRIEDLLQDRAMRTTMGQAGRHKVSRDYSYHKLVSEIQDLYLELGPNGVGQ
jgi:glycosyltransferase involved in cell wall biosynthesis